MLSEFNIGLPDRRFLTFYPSPDIRINYGDPITGQTGRLFLPFDVRVGPNCRTMLRCRARRADHQGLSGLQSEDAGQTQRDPLKRESVMWRRLGAEFFGTFWLTFAGCGSAVLAANFPSLGIGFLGVSLAFGLTVLTMAYAVGHISGGHFNSAVTIGLWAGGRFKATDVLPYIITQVAGAIGAAVVLYVIASGKPGLGSRRVRIQWLW